MTSTPVTRTAPFVELFVIFALSAVTTVPFMTWMGSDAGTVTFTALYSLSTVSVTGTVAVVEVSANAPSERHSARSESQRAYAFSFQVLTSFSKSLGRLAPPRRVCISLGHDVVPLDHEHDVGNIGVLNDVAQRGDNRAVGND